MLTTEQVDLLIELGFKEVSEGKWKKIYGKWASITLTESTHSWLIVTTTWCKTYPEAQSDVIKMRKGGIM